MQTITDPLAVVVTRDQSSAGFATVLLEETQFRVINCNNTSAFLDFMKSNGEHVAMAFVDLDVVEPALVGRMADRLPLLRVVTTGSAEQLAATGDAVEKLRKPWLPLELLIQAETAQQASGPLH